MRWHQSLTQRQRVILLVLAASVVAVVGLLTWSVWSALRAASSVSPLVTPNIAPFSPLSTPSPAPTGTPAGAPVPTPEPTFDVYRAGIISEEVADARGVRSRWGTPLTLVDDLDMARAFYAHYQRWPPLALRMRPALQALGLWDWDPLRLDVVTQAEQAASLYAPELAELYLRRDWDGPTTTLETQLAYGYARALPDQYGDLTRLMEETSSLDHQLALSAIADADALVSVWLLNEVMPSAPGDADARAIEIKAEIARAVCPQWQVDDALLDVLSCFAFDLGATFVSSQYREGGVVAMDEVILRPPRSTEQILHPDRYAESDEPRLISPIDPALGNQWALTETETLGEALMGIVLANWSDGSVGADEVIDWGGDLLQVWEGPEGDTVAAWQIDWDDSKTASLFHGLLLELMPRSLLRGLIRDTTPPAPIARGRWWAGGQGAVFLYRRANHVWLVWGQDPAAVESVAVAALP